LRMILINVPAPHYQCIRGKSGDAS